MTNVILIILLAAIIGYAAWRSVRKLRKGGGCCGEHEQVSLNAVKDRDKAHYPYRVKLDIGGMTCDNCARRVTNALNALDGTWATVRFDSKTADVRLKNPPDEDALRQAVAGAGYVVIGVNREQAECRGTTSSVC